MFNPWEEIGYPLQYSGLEVTKSWTLLSDFHFQFHFINISVQFSSVTQSCPTLCDSTDFTVHGILQARILEWVAVPFSGGPSQPRD